MDSLSILGKVKQIPTRYDSATGIVTSHRRTWRSHPNSSKVSIAEHDLLGRFEVAAWHRVAQREVLT